MTRLIPILALLLLPSCMPIEFTVVAEDPRYERWKTDDGRICTLNRENATFCIYTPPKQ